MSDVDVEVVEDLGPESTEEKISRMEQDTIDGLTTFEFLLNEVGYRIQGFFSRILFGDSFDEERMESLDPDVDAIKSHMEGRVDLQ